MTLAERFPDLILDGPDERGLLRLTLCNPGRKNALTLAQHRQLAELWPHVDAHPAVRSVLVRGDGDAFSAGGDFAMLEAMVEDPAVRVAVFEEARLLVHNLVACATPVVAGVRGPAVGAGLTVALLADVCVAAADARLLDGHVRIGVPAGDHAVLVWPLLCGMANAKRHLLLPDAITGAEAQRIGLVAECAPDEQVDAVAEELARRLAAASSDAVRWTKRALHGWLHQALPAFDASLALEFLAFGQDDAREGLAAVRERRDPRFGPAR